jgi:imidazolonepropionase-like amidohydrolase
MHVHLRGGKDLVEDNESWLKLFLANGITTIRDMGGDIPTEVLRWRGEIREGRREGPRILTCGPKLDGPKPSWPGSIAVATPEEGRAAVRAVKAIDADFVKLYFGIVSSEVHAAILDEARAKRLPVTGHLPGNLSFREVTARGQHIEHGFYPMLDGASTQSAEIRAEFAQSPNPSAQEAFQVRIRRQLDSLDPKLMDKVAEQLKEPATWVTMTLTIGGRKLNLPADNHASHPLRKYMYPGIWKSWDLDSGRRKAPAGDAIRQTQQLVRVAMEAVPVFHRVGVNMLAGSDCGASNNFAWPGWSLHEELAAFVEAGLSPLDALKLATRSAARFLKEESERGTIEKGKIADLVLLDANPLEDIRNTQKIAGVMVRGKWHDRRALDRILGEVEAGAARRTESGH